MSFVLAYHGCDLKTAQELLGGSPFLASTQDYDWLGQGSYFWENDAVRAYQWAIEPRRRFTEPSLVGAVIELGRCLDLTTQTGIAAVKLAHTQFVAMAKRDGVFILESLDSAMNPSGDRIIRRLDCAVMDHLYAILLIAQEADPTIQGYATVRALFPEGDEIYPGAGFWDKTHVQLRVREPEQVFGVFRIPQWQSEALGLPHLCTER